MIDLPINAVSFLLTHIQQSARVLRGPANRHLASEHHLRHWLLVEQGFTKNYDYARQTMRDVIYGKWRDYNPEDTVRFYALRLHEVGMIKSVPQQIIARGTDWRVLNQLKRELKG